mmetsp:Transcript_9651/g.32053  ORF Transcript_9651/g.32053 Transcript_9651/m.32053 type:complete len:440 (-) Transcript_9651:1224-2543(-)
MHAQCSQPAWSHPTDGATTSPASSSRTVPHEQQRVCGPSAVGSSSAGSGSASRYLTTTREPATLAGRRPRTVRTDERVRESAASALTATQHCSERPRARVSPSRTSHVWPSRPPICVPSISVCAPTAGSSGLADASPPSRSSQDTGGVSSISGSPRRRYVLTTATHQPSACSTCTGSPGAGAQPRGRCGTGGRTRSTSTRSLSLVGTASSSSLMSDLYSTVSRFCDMRVATAAYHAPASAGMLGATSSSMSFRIQEVVGPVSHLLKSTAVSPPSRASNAAMAAAGTSGASSHEHSAYGSCCHLTKYSSKPAASRREMTRSTSMCDLYVTSTGSPSAIRRRKRASAALDSRPSASISSAVFHTERTYEKPRSLTRYSRTRAMRRGASAEPGLESAAGKASGGAGVARAAAGAAAEHPAPRDGSAVGCPPPMSFSNRPGSQ